MKDPVVPSTVVLRSHIPGDWGWILSKHEEIFGGKEFGWNPLKVAEFVSSTLGEFIPKAKLPRHGVWIAEANGVPVGSILLDQEDDCTARIRLLHVIPEGRGMGIGLKLVNECIKFSRESGYSKIMLFTTSAQTDGLRLYEKLGFTETGREEKLDKFGPSMEGIYMELVL